MSRPVLEERTGRATRRAADTQHRHSSGMERMAIVNFNMPDEHLRAIGRVTAHFALLENALAHLAWELLAVPRELGESVTCELSFRGLVSLISSLYRQRATDPRRIEAVDELLTRASQVEEKRNTIVHSLWLSQGTTDAVVGVKVTAKKTRGLHYHAEQVSVAELEAVAAAALEVAGEVLDLAVWRVLRTKELAGSDSGGNDA